MAELLSNTHQYRCEKVIEDWIILFSSFMWLPCSLANRANRPSPDGILPDHSGCRGPMGFYLHPSLGLSDTPDALASQGTAWKDLPAKLARGRCQSHIPEPRPRSLLLKLVVVIRKSFTGKGCKPHPKHPDQGLGWLLAKGRVADIPRENFTDDPLFHP